MTLDADLKERLRTEAERLQVEDAPHSAIVRRARRGSAARTGGRVLLGLVAIAVAAGTWLYVQDEPERHQARMAPAPLTRGEEAPQPAPQPGGGSFAYSERAGTPQAGGGGGGGGAAAASVEAAEPSAVTGAVIGPGGGGSGRGGSTVVAASPRVIKTANLEVRIPDGTFARAFGRAEQVAARHGGFVMGSATYTAPARSGDLTIRVPSERFEVALGDLRALGVVTSQRVRGEDVTAQFVDLEARLRNWEVHERVLLRLNEQATSIGESLQVQRELQSVQLEVERLRGQLQVLADQTSLGTITLTIREAAIAEEAEREPRGTWDRAVAAAEKVFTAIVVGFGYLAPIAAVLLVLWLAARVVRGRRTER